MGNFNHLPSDIQLDIITRLPAECILDCKLVCKSLRNLVSNHPSFSQLHLSRINHSDDSGKYSFLIRDNDKDLYCFEYTEKNDETPPHYNTTRRIKFSNPFGSSYRYNFVGSVNGLVCLHGWGAYCICNPMTREYVMLPKFKRVRDGIYCSSGFGYLPLTNEYKVVEMYELRLWPDAKFAEVAVYTLGNGKGWRNIGSLNPDSCLYYSTHGVFMDGLLHWVHKRGGRVLTLDLTEEKFDYLSPPHLPPDNSCYVYIIGVLNGVLFYTIKDYSFNTEWMYSDIWLLKNMKEQVQQEAWGWSKEVSLPKREPLAYTKGGAVLCLGGRSLIVYDPVALTSERLVTFRAFNQVIFYKKTLVSLKGLVAEEDIKFME